MPWDRDTRELGQNVRQGQEWDTGNAEVEKAGRASKPELEACSQKNSELNQEAPTGR